MIEIENLPYEEFRELSDEQILKSSIRKLLDDAKQTGNQDKIKLRTLIGNYETDKTHIKTPEKLTKFVEGFRKLRTKNIPFKQFESSYYVLSIECLQR